MRPRPPADAYLRLRTLPGEQALISVSAMTVTSSNPAVQPTSSPLVIGAFAYHELSDVTFRSNGLAISGGTDIISFNTPVPEASASSMLLAGLAVMGLVAGIRRRAR